MAAALGLMLLVPVTGSVAEEAALGRTNSPRYVQFSMSNACGSAEQLGVSAQLKTVASTLMSSADSTRRRRTFSTFAGLSARTSGTASTASGGG